jgi:periplasmic protein CpxP/Spy
MRNRMLAIAGIAVLVIGATVFALGHGLPAMQGPEKGHGHGPGRHGMGPDMIEHLAKALSLTDAQKTQVKALFDAAHAAEEPRHEKLMELHKQMEAATANGQFDETQVRAIASQQAQLMTESMVEHERMKSKIYAILTPEQRVKAEELHKDMERHGRPGPPHGPPPPPSN